MMIKPEIQNYILCLRVKNAETTDRKTPFDEIYTGYYDGRIVYNTISETAEIQSEELWKDEAPIVDIQYDLSDRIFFVLSNGDLYFVHNRIANKLFRKVTGKIGKMLFLNKNRSYLFFRAGNRICYLDLIKEKGDTIKPKKAFGIEDLENFDLIDYEFDFGNKILYALGADGMIHVKGFGKDSNLSTQHRVTVASKWSRVSNMFTLKAKKERLCSALASSRDNRYLAVAAHSTGKNETINTILIYEIKQTDNQPILIDKHDFMTTWPGDCDYVGQLDMKLTINGNYVVSCVTQCTSEFHAFVLKGGKLHHIIKGTPIHKRNLSLTNRHDQLPRML